jgi:phage terminase large subunit
LFTRYTLSSANISVIPEFREKIDLLGVGDEFNMTNAQISHKVTKSEIIFSGIKTSSGKPNGKVKVNTRIERVHRGRGRRVCKRKGL